MARPRAARDAAGPALEQLQRACSRGVAARRARRTVVRILPRVCRGRARTAVHRIVGGALRRPRRLALREERRELVALVGHPFKTACAMFFIFFHRLPATIHEHDSGQNAKFQNLFGLRCSFCSREEGKRGGRQRAGDDQVSPPARVLVHVPVPTRDPPHDARRAALRSARVCPPCLSALRATARVLLRGLREAATRAAHCRRGRAAADRAGRFVVVPVWSAGVRALACCWPRWREGATICRLKSGGSCWS